MDIEQRQHFGEQASKLADLFMERKVLLTSEIMALGFGSHTRRISDLRKAGWIITCKKLSVSECQYTHEGFLNQGQQELFSTANFEKYRKTFRKMAESYFYGRELDNQDKKVFGIRETNAERQTREVEQ